MGALAPGREQRGGGVALALGPPAAAATAVASLSWPSPTAPMSSAPATTPATATATISSATRERWLLLNTLSSSSLVVVAVIAEIAMGSALMGRWVRVGVGGLVECEGM